MTESLIVQKYGGSSLATPEAIRQVAGKVVATRQQGHRVVVVVSAMGDETDRLLGLALGAAADPDRRELDVLLATGEQVSTALLSMAIRGLGVKAVSLSGAQCGILTNDVHTNARILELVPERVRRELDSGAVVVAAGFQGVSPRGEVTTLGRGGSDTTAVALAAALGAERCEIYTDVDGVYTADPRVLPEARLLAELSSRETQELAWHGAQVLKAEAVEFASTNGVSLSVRSTFSPGSGTRVVPDGAPGYWPQRRPISGVSGRRDLVRLRIVGSADCRGVVDRVAQYDLIFGTRGRDGTTLYLSTLEIPDVALLTAELREQHGAQVEVEEDLGAVSLVGFGLGSRAASLLDAMEALEDAGVPVEETFSSRESFTFVVPDAQVVRGVEVLHRAFVEGWQASALLEAAQA